MLSSGLTAQLMDVAAPCCLFFATAIVRQMNSLSVFEIPSFELYVHEQVAEKQKPRSQVNHTNIVVRDLARQT